MKGTCTTAGEILEFEAGAEAVDCQTAADIHEVINYRAAMRQAVELMIDLFFHQPIFGSTSFIEHPPISPSSARRILGLLTDGGTLKVVRPAAGSRSAIYAFPELLSITEGRDVY